MLATENNAGNLSGADGDLQITEKDSMSRSDIAQSLGSKDPTWFKQTQDRGHGSAAYRRNLEEGDGSDTSSRTGSMRMPGMSRECTAEPESEITPPPDFSRSIASSRDGSVRGSNGLDNGLPSSASVPSATGTRSPLPTMNRQRFEPPSSDTSSSLGGDTASIGRTIAMSPSQGRLSPERIDRPMSPTKGLGGFVQSAMLKRSDSVNKRWSAQAGPGLSRGNSIASNPSGYEAPRYSMGGITPLAESRPNRLSREASPTPISRPQSSHSNATIKRRDDGLDRDERPKSSINKASPSSFQNGSQRTPPLDTKLPTTADADAQPIMSPPSSPSKRWSPSKSSWLENALNKPESPKVLSSAPQQPSWMTDINRAKQQRGSVDLKGANFKEVTTGGLMRSPPPGSGYKVPGLIGLSNALGASKATTSIAENFGEDANSDQPIKKNDMKTRPPPETPLNIASTSNIPQYQSKTTAPDDAGMNRLPEGSKEIFQSEILPTNKPKREAPPKKDFTSSLKPRQASGETKAQEEPEFKNVFGKLKRTQTQNYKAPDELKDNILRGKAGLAFTGGPKKTERKDEFKESILNKKKGMVAPSASTRITSASSKHADTSTPEAIQKRQGLARSNSVLSDGSGHNEKREKKEETTKPEALAKFQNLRDKPKAPSHEKESSAPMTVNANARLGVNFASSLAGVLQRGPPPMSGGSKPSAAETKDDKEIVAPVRHLKQEVIPDLGPQLTHATKARARGPKRRLPTASKKHTDPEQLPTVQKQSPRISSKESKHSLAKDVTQSPASPLTPSKNESRPLSNITNSNNNNRKTSQPLSPRKPSTTITLDKDVASPNQPPVKPFQAEPSPTVKQKPSSPHIESAPSTSTPASQAPAKSLSKPLVQKEARPLSSQDAPVQKASALAPRVEEAPLPSVKGAAATWGQPLTHGEPSRARSPVKLPTRKDEEAAMENAGLRPKEPPAQVMQSSAVDPQRQAVSSPSMRSREVPRPLVQSSSVEPQRPAVSSPSARSREVPAPVVQNSIIEVQKSAASLPSLRTPKSPPLPWKKPESIVNRVMSTTLPPPASPKPPTSPVSSSSATTQLFADIFDESPSSKTNIIVDAQAALDSRTTNDSSQKIKTLRKQISEIIDNGKIVPVPSHQEHVLFEDSLYLCTHVFGTPAGQRTTEVYLWCGDGASSSAVEDAQLFAKKVAKDHNGKLILLKQGKETSNFFQALGGIVIIRRGSSTRADPSSGSAATYMLCGRQHVGQIAFDEVEFHPSSLCSGFPYIISARFGKLYLWKGSGAGADELGCARLIGMDLGLTGEIEEIEEGKEPAEFWSSFSDSRPRSPPNAIAHFWHLKPSCEKYANRLFSIDVETPRPKSSSGFMQWGRRGSAPSNDANAPLLAQIREMLAFSQVDLIDDGVFVLDAFFEIFVLVLYSIPPPNHTATNPSPPHPTVAPFPIFPPSLSIP